MRDSILQQAGKEESVPVLDPDDYNTAYVVEEDAVYTTSNLGSTWNNISGNLTDTNLQAIEFIPGGVAL